MDISPGFSAFASEYEKGRPQAVFVRLVADLETPVSVFLKLAEGKDNAFLLESVQGGEARGRYSIVGFNPDLIWRCRDGKTEVQRSDGLVSDTDSDAPLKSLKRHVDEARMALPEELPPMSVGLFGYLGYESCATWSVCRHRLPMC